MRLLRHLLFIISITLLSACGDDVVKGKYLSTGSTVLALGDSLTEGYGAQRGEDYPALLAQKSGWHIINAGISGNTSAQALARLPALIQEHHPQLIIISIGGNDFLRRQPNQETRQNIKEIIALSKASGAQIILIGIPALNAGAALGIPSDHELYAELAQAENITLYANAWGDILKHDKWRSDAIHPNATGYAQFSENFYQFLREAQFIP